MDSRNPNGDKDDWHLTSDLHAETGMGDPFAAAIRATRMSMIITDPRQVDNPIVFANQAFLKLSGYRREDVLGRNCRFLQGPGTDPEAVGRIRDAIQSRSDINIDVLNYRKDGSEFWNALYISPVSNEKGELQFFFASQLDVTDRKQSESLVHAEKDRFELAVKDRTRDLERALEMQTSLLHEVDHRVKNNLQMISSLIMMQSRTISDPTIRQSLKSMLSRVEALSTVHRRLYQSDDVSRFDVADFVRDLVGDLVGASSRELDTELQLEPVEVSADKAAPIALMVNELVTNSLKHAFDGQSGNTLGVKVNRFDGHFVIEVSDNGAGMNGARGSNSFGMNLMKSLARQLRATIEWHDAAPGTRVVINMPVEAA